MIAADALKGESGKLEAQSLNDTNNMELRVHANDARAHAVLTANSTISARGASRAAVQNLELMLGL